MKFNISTPNHNDRQQWQATYKAYAAFYKMDPSPAVYDEVWRWIHCDHTPFYALIVKNESGNIIGLMHFRSQLSPLRGTSVGFLDDLFLDPAYRGSAIVDELFTQLKAKAKEHRWPFVRWITAEDNYRARNVYNRIADKTTWVTYQMNTD
ncbi:MAG: GNAT family N-acetyltransferase [Pseudomonadales bacterium]|nr:GNAT family N-acetyltransferase [Pseudomonadales bacterium]